MLLLGEPLTGWKLAGLAAALGAVWLLLGGDAGAVPLRGSARSALTRALVAMAAMGIANFLYKVGAATGGNPATFIAGQAIVFMPLATAFAWKMEGGIRPPRHAWRYGATTAALFLVALVMMFESLRPRRGERAGAHYPDGLRRHGGGRGDFFAGAVPFRKGAGLASAVAALACLAKS